MNHLKITARKELIHNITARSGEVMNNHLKIGVSFSFFFFFFLLISTDLVGQENEADSSMINELEEVSNVQTFTPSKLLKKGQIDVQLFNNLYTQTASRDANRKLTESGRRDTYFATFGQVLIGTSKSARVNWGFDVIFKSVRIDPDPKSASLKVLGFESSNSTRTAITTIGPKIKFSPIKALPDFSVQSALWIPIANDLEADENGKPWLDWDRFTSWTQFFYSQQLGSKFQFFYEFDLLARLSKPASWYANGQAKDHVLSTPTSFFVNYFSTSKSTVYAMVQYAPTFGFDGGSVIDADYTQLGIGGKYQLTSHFAVELLYSSFVMAKNTGAGRTYNVGLRYIR